MIEGLRRQFNERYTPELYARFLRRMTEVCGAEVGYRQCETPIFLPEDLTAKMSRYGAELIHQVLDHPDYYAASSRMIPPQFLVPNEAPHPMFVQADFGLVRAGQGGFEPKLVEIQGFPSLYGYQAVLARTYQEVYGLDPSLRYLFGGLTEDSYCELLSEAICAGHDPENVILLEIDPLRQKTYPDFAVTEALLGVRPVCVTAIQKEGNRLFYSRDGRRVPIQRIYNRLIFDELVRKQIQAPFDFRDDLQVEWAGHPNWFFRLSKFSIPYFSHSSVPRTVFLDRAEGFGLPPEDAVLKPLFSFAGLGVKVGVTREELDAVPAEQRGDFILQERVDFAPTVETPHGPTKAEIRIMYIWTDQLRPVTTIIRMGRGKMMGVDQNRNQEWVGAAAAFY